MPFTLVSGADDQETINGYVACVDGALLIFLDGYGRFCPIQGYAAVASLEIFTRGPELFAWGNVHSDEVTHRVSLLGADRRLLDPEVKQQEKVTVRIEKWWLDAVNELQRTNRKLADREARGDDVRGEYGDLDEAASDLLRNVDLTPAEAPPKE